MPGPMANGSNGEIHSHIDRMDEPRRTPNRLILCFDGTGNSFSGNTQDTNIVKLYDKFDRSAPHQMHYYQPGIGTYTADGSSINTGWFGKIKRSISQVIDQGLATTFDAHVIAGYRFLMRYYGPGDRIYIFGFSRGAFTARFLARMVSKVGLLSMGNEEMVPFAYKVYQDYVMELPQSKDYIKNFKKTFCRDEHDGTEHNENEVGIKVHFLGLFDTVNSVGTFDIPFTKTAKLSEVSGTAEHIRHAVAIDERRVKFKAALLQQEEVHSGEDCNKVHPGEDADKVHPKEDIDEVWFAGNHGDIGGGWPAVSPEEAKAPKKFGEKLKAQKEGQVSGNEINDSFQASDIALKWMIDELNKLGAEVNGDQIQWDKKSLDTFNAGYKKKKTDAIRSNLHDTMKLGGGSGIGKVILWNILEYLPFIKRWELEGIKWVYTRFPLNRGGTRDIPIGAKFHPSVLERRQLSQFDGSRYAPTNAVTVKSTKTNGREETHALRCLELVEHKPESKQKKDKYLRARLCDDDNRNQQRYRD